MCNFRVDVGIVVVIVVVAIIVLWRALYLLYPHIRNEMEFRNIVETQHLWLIYCFINSFLLFSFCFPARALRNLSCKGVLLHTYIKMYWRSFGKPQFIVSFHFSSDSFFNCFHFMSHDPVRTAEDDDDVEKTKEKLSFFLSSGFGETKFRCIRLLCTTNYLLLLRFHCVVLCH